MNATEQTEPVYCSEGIQILRAPVLVDEGWEGRTVTDPKRIDERVYRYTDLGFATTPARLEPATRGLEVHCSVH